MLSETLRLELAPLDVRVITLVAGNVSSNISVNAERPTALPRTSQYLPIEKDIITEGEWNDMDRNEFAKKIVDDVLKKVTGKVWLGSSTGIIRWTVPLMPQWVFVSSPTYSMMRLGLEGCADLCEQDRIMINLGRGVAKMPKRA